jgi:hypothetical protein
MSLSSRKVFRRPDDYETNVIEIARRRSLLSHEVRYHFNLEKVCFP